MSRVRQSRTAAEGKVDTILASLGFRYRRNVRTLAGSPDFSNKARHWAIFVNGCFWHHHANCGRATIPKSNTSFWRAKFKANRSRDLRKTTSLRADGFTVIVVWECDLENPTRVAKRLSKILKAR